MTNEDNTLSFEQRLEKSKFVFNDELLQILFDRKLKQLQEQSKESKELQSLLKRSIR